MSAHRERWGRRGKFGNGTLHGRAPFDGGEPACDVRIIGQLYAMMRPKQDPGPAGDIGDGKGVPNPFALRKMAVQHLVKARGFIRISPHRIRQYFGRIVSEMSRLTQRRSLPRHLPHQPAECLRSGTGGLRQQRAALFGNIDQNGAGFEQRQRIAAVRRRMIDDAGNLAVGVDRQIGGRELLALENVQRPAFIDEAEFLQCDQDLDDVGGIASENLYHGCSFPAEPPPCVKARSAARRPACRPSTMAEPTYMPPPASRFPCTTPSVSPAA